MSIALFFEVWQEQLKQILPKCLYTFFRATHRPVLNVSKKLFQLQFCPVAYDNEMRSVVLLKDC